MSLYLCAYIYLLAAAEGEHHLSGYTDRRPGLQPRNRPTALSGGRGSGTGYFDIPQLSGRIDYFRPRDPGYDEIRAARHRYVLHGTSGVNGRRTTGCRNPR